VSRISRAEKRSQELAPTRRQLILLAATALGSTLFGRRGLAGPTDQGIGGTGVRPPDEESDRGIGGTGVIGTIRKFGSIVVNDMRIAYPSDVAVRIDGQPATVADLKLGHVVRVAASGDAGAYSTRMIDVTSEVVGPVERRSGKTLTVAGQTVSTSALKGGDRWAVGDRVAVSGLRRTDGTVAASLIEPRPGDGIKVAGPVTQAADGSVRIGNLPLSGASAALIGQRAVVEGTLTEGRLSVLRGTPETELLPRDISRLSVEAYVERHGGNLRLGSGLAVSGSPASLPAGRAVRAVLTTTVGSGGRLSIEGLRAGNRAYPVGPGARGSGRAPGAHDPGARGSDGRGGLGLDRHGAGEQGSRDVGRGQQGGPGSGADRFRPFGGGGPGGFSGPGFGGGFRGGPGGGGRR
jgi:hypothetical protein